MSSLERIFLRAMMAAFAVSLLTGAVLGPSRVLAALLGAGPPAPGELVPRQIPYRGYVERDGLPVNALSGLEMAFTLSPSDGGVPWREVQTVIVAAGQFSTDLGDDGGIPASLLDDPGLSLTIQVQPSGGGAALNGSQRVLTVPFSHRARVAWDARHAVAADFASAASGGLVTQLVPPGLVSAFAGSVPPTGWLLCDGAAVSRATYPALFAAIGTSSGSGDGVSTFNLPDYRGRFLRGVDDGSGRDPDSASRVAENGGASGSAVGSVQDDAFERHEHPLMIRTGSSTGGGAYSFNANGSNFQQDGTAYPFLGFAAGNGDNETRPANVYVRFIIKL